MQLHDDPTLSVITPSILACSAGMRMLLGVCVAGAMLLATGEARSQAFEYAVKFVCGTADARTPPVVARGAYFTAINVHNPNGDTVEFQKKIAIALPSEKAGRVSRFFPAALKSDEALEIDCPDILKHADAGGFNKGFVVIESKFELDVVAVYSTAASATGTVTALHMERVPARKK